MKSVFLTGASGVGKTTTYRTLVEMGLQPSPNYLTRNPRPGEIDGLDAHFISRELFAIKLASGLLLEKSMEEAEYVGVCYGSPRLWLDAVEANSPAITATPSNVVVLQGLRRTLEERGKQSNLLWVNLHAEQNVRHARISTRISDLAVLSGRLHSGVSQGVQPQADLNIDTGRRTPDEVIEQIFDNI